MDSWKADPEVKDSFVSMCRVALRGRENKSDGKNLSFH